ncbi:MAG: hypothetical protein GX030_07235 [Firmicutes bacterium]|nr:hypothetical protein [Bacillota bacterium]
MNDLASWGNLAITFLALVVSGVSLSKSSRAQNEANKLQQKLVQIEEQRERDRTTELLQADLHATLVKDDKSYRLLLVNSGKAKAQNLRIRLDRVPLENHCAFAGQPAPPHIGPNSQASIHLAIALDCRPPYEIEVKWDDDFGKDRVYESTLTF